MADESIKFKLDLDSQAFTESAKKALEAIKNLEEAGEKVSGFVSLLGDATLLLGTVATASYAFKQAIDLSEEAETIRRTEEQFKDLTAAAGLSARTLQEGLEKSSQGLVDNTDLMKLANEALTKMGASASKLPEIMDIARKATAVFGGDLTSNFNNITNAIANGNTRILGRQYGIIIDANKAVKDFAESQGVASNTINEAGRRQAILNAALEQGQQRFKGVSGNLGETTTAMQQLKVTLNDLKEMFILAFDKTIGPSLHNFLGVVTDVTAKAKTALTSMFGEGLQQNNAAIEQTESKLNALKGALIDLEHQKGEGSFLDKIFNGSKENQIAQLNRQIQQTTALLDNLRSKNQELKTQDDELEKSKQANYAEDQKAAKDDIINKDAAAKNNAKFRSEMAQADQAYFKEREKNISSLSDLEEVSQHHLIDLAIAHQQKEASINQDEALNAAQKYDLMKVEASRYSEALKANEREVAALRSRLMNEYVANSKNTFQGIQRAGQQMSNDAKKDLLDFGKTGQNVMLAFKQNSVNAFTNMGAAMAQGVPIAKATTDAIKGLFLGMLGDIAIAEGTKHLIAGVFPPNPVELAVGAGLITLGGALKSAAASSGAGATTASTGATITSPSAASATNNGVTQTTYNNPSESQASSQQRVVNVNIAGNYMDTDTTRRQLMELIRQETNATDFRYNVIGT